jgi:hypothetical protein
MLEGVRVDKKPVDLFLYEIVWKLIYGNVVNDKNC